VAEPRAAGFTARIALARAVTLLRKVAPLLGVGALFFLGRHSAYWTGAAWGLAMLLSMSGWGLAVELLVRPRQPIDMGLSMAWGLVLTLAVGGVACALHIAQGPFLIAQVLVGSLLAAGVRVRRWRPAPSRRRWLATMARPSPYLVAIATLFAIANNYLGLLGDYQFNESDDPPLYIYLAEKIVQTGSPLDPFNSRRVALYGGVDYLNAQFAAVGKYYELHVVDGGVGALLLFALIVGAVAPRGLRRANAGLLAVPLFLLTNLGEVRINIGSLLTGAVAFVGVYRTVIWIHDERSDGKPIALSRLAVLGACIMATSILRPSNAMPIALFVGLVLIGRRMKIGLRMTWPGVWSLVRDATYCGLFCLAFLIPWLTVFRESVGTFVYPLIKGNATAGFALFKPEAGLAFNLRHLIDDLAYSPIDTSLLLLAAGLLPLGWGIRRPKVPADFVVLLAIICFGSLCLTSYMFGAFESFIDARYTYACLVGSILIIVVSIVPRRETSNNFVASPRALLVVAAVTAHVAGHREGYKNAVLARIDLFERGRTTSRDVAARDNVPMQKYLDVQAHVPEHETVVVVVPEPFRFNFKRNVVFSLDSPGGLGPSPGFPVFKGPDVLTDYFLRNGVRYLITVNFHSTIDLLNPDRWQRVLGLEHNYGAYEGPFVIDALHSVEKVVQTHRVIYENFGMKVTDLRQPATS
jgi:hypothetical protein